MVKRFKLPIGSMVKNEGNYGDLNSSEGYVILNHIHICPTFGSSYELLDLETGVIDNYPVLFGNERLTLCENTSQK